MPKRKPIFTRGTGYFDIRIPVPSTDRQWFLFHGIVWLVIIVSWGTVFYRTITSPTHTMYDLLIDIGMLFILLSGPLVVLWGKIHDKKKNKI